MRIDDSPFHRVWREPDEIDIAALRADRQADAEQAPGSPFWHPGPAAPTVLQQLPPAALTPPPPAPPPAPYVGEPPVDAAWLQQREQAFGAVRADFEAARAAAQADVGGAGWVDAVLVTDESGSTHSASGRATVFVPDSNAPPQQIGWDEGGPVYAAVTGRTLEFDEDAFAAHYRAQGGAPLQNLARLYDTDAGTLLARHPELWTVATHDHAINAGPPPAGRAMGDPGQLGMLDLYLADPQIAELIQTHGGRAAPASGGIALEQARIYGEQRYEQLTKLGNAMQAVRDDYDAALARAQSQGGPGWVDRPRMVTWTDESGARTTQPMVVYDESGQGTPVIDHVFDPDLFTDWYLAQDGVANRAFASFYGRSHSEFGTDESGRQFVTRIGFDNPNWEMWGIGGGMSHRELVRIDPNSPPRLNDNNAVGFDLEAGWATHHTNIHHKRDWFETLVQVVIVAGVAYISAGTLGPAAAGAAGMTTTTAAGATVLTAGGMVVSAAVVGAATSFVSGAMNGNLSLKGVLRGALSGALTAGLTQGLEAVAGPLNGAAAIAGRATIQGGVQALMGGSFTDGAIAGFASGLADQAGAKLNAEIDAAVGNGTMDAAAAAGARTFARVLSSAIRAAGNPDDPAFGFAQAFLDQTFAELDPAGFRRPVVDVRPGTPGTVFDDDGNLMPGVVDRSLPASQQYQQLTAALTGQGLGADEAAALALQQLSQAGADTRTARGYFVPDERHDAALAHLRAEWSGLGQPGGDDPAPIDETPAVTDPERPTVTLPPVVVTGRRITFADELADRIGGTLGTLYEQGKALGIQGLQMAADGLSLLDVPALQEFQGRVRNYLDERAAAGGLSEAEMVLFGALYAANEALMPTNVLDFSGGIGKGIGAAAIVLRAGGKIDDVADVVRAESKLIAQATEARVAEVSARARNEGLELVTERAGTKGDWNAHLNGPLKPNALYLLDNGHAYKTDATGRVVQAEARLDVGKADRNTWQQAAAGHVGGEGYDGGHLIATLFGGAGERINLVPQLSAVNRGEFRTMEQELAKAVLDGKPVRLEVTPSYASGGAVPDTIRVRYWIDGELNVHTFNNTKGG